MKINQFFCTRNSCRLWIKSLEVWLVFLRLGFTSFGGPFAHLSYFRNEFVTKRNWLCDTAYADLVALCQFLPGPASSQVGMAIGFMRQGIWGAVLAWVGFTLPSAVFLIFFAIGISHLEGTQSQQWPHALKVVAVAVVGQAVLGMGKKLCPDLKTKTVAAISSVFVLLFPSAFTQILVLIAAGLLGLIFFSSQKQLPHSPLHQGRRSLGGVFLALFVILLFALPALRSIYPNDGLKLLDSFYRSGALVFGGGHVVLPLLQAEVVPTGWVSDDLFMAGYGAANAIPGPLFTFSAYLGAVSSLGLSGWRGGLLGLIAIFLPSFLLVLGILPFWEKLRTFLYVRKSIVGVNAAVVGILLAALYHPVWNSAISSPKDFALALVSFLLLEFWKIPSWAVVILGVGVSFLS